MQFYKIIFQKKTLFLIILIKKIATPANNEKKPFILQPY